MKLFSTSCESVYVGWDQPLLNNTVDWLANRFSDGAALDLSGLLCVLPSSRAADRLGEQLKRHAAANGQSFRRPEMITIGQLAERLYEPTLPLALEFEQTLAWANVLRQLRSDELSPLIPVVPPPEPLSPWLELAGMLRRLHEELAASGLSFHDVHEAAESESEKRRWKLLDHVCKRYLLALDEAGVSDPHAQRRLALVDERCQTRKSVVLIGTSDLSDALISMLRNLDSEVFSIIAAPPSQADHFDEFGCVVTDRWIEHQLPLLDVHLVSAGDVADQAQAVSETLAEFADRYSADQVTVGVTDPTQVGPIEMHLRGCGVHTFRQVGWTVSQTSIGRLLSLTATHLQRRTWQSLAALVRHADVNRWITAELGEPNADRWLTQLDRLLGDHFPVRIDKPLPPKAVESAPLAIAMAKQIEKWLAPFAASSGGSASTGGIVSTGGGGERPIAQWSQWIGQWLRSLYGIDEPTDPESVDLDSANLEPTDFDAGPVGASETKADPIEAVTDQEPDTDGESDPAIDSGADRSRTSIALDAALKLIQRFVDLNDGLDLEMPGAAAIEMLAVRLGDVRIVGTAKPDDVEILGWLDLALDDSPAMTVVGLNHPFVPGATTADPFLPGSLRTKLRMMDNDRRYARDVYAMHLMLSTRQDIRFIVGKSGADGSPTPPSRLLAAAPAKDSARRVRMLLEKQRPSFPIHHQWDQPPATTGTPSEGSRLPIPEFDLSGSDDIVKTMSVTAFRDYLACPYRFYLRHVLRLKPLDDATTELAANQFGDLVHGALERFGESSDRDEESADRITKRLIEHLHEYTDEFYGSDASTAVAIQVAQAERRLQAVAVAQAERRAAGWTIHASEASVSEKDGSGIEVDGKWMGLRGRFDRIDHHAATDRWAILDYKTHGHKPEKKHLEKTASGLRWIDLQLPLYRMMIPFLGIEAPPREVALGYFNVSEKDDETRINLAEFPEPLMDQAEQIIHDCIRGIWAKEFAPTSGSVDFDDYSMILQTDVASRMMAAADAMDAAENPS
ncbi:ATP-dependent helicase/deoxyribonuclease subunit B [Rubripirellula lacrimiformis]|uniref:ATP-dependent helicase/deoxyribonuclease subunit B n=1 Tax=Rubripirellula lacrimiformis TaxID=1930273 RepID=A0A517N6T2_9BACT|nr:PD-(D/E)XK nuclease family protein [Rubripirellula lacrimiformis]QDT02859.1 ATP-dependent helicase/deoxyribonuclease subunit B [Rubripirellula lacrimiformis]